MGCIQTYRACVERSVGELSYFYFAPVQGRRGANFSPFSLRKRERFYKLFICVIFFPTNLRIRQKFDLGKTFVLPLINTISFISLTDIFVSRVVGQKKFRTSFDDRNFV